MSRGERELRQKQRLRGRKKSLVEDYGDQPSESDLSDLFGFGLAPDDGSTRSRGNPAQGETAVMTRCRPLLLLCRVLTDSDSETFAELTLSGLTMLGLFWDELNPLSKEIHPALPTILEEKQSENKLRGGRYQTSSPASLVTVQSVQTEPTTSTTAPQWWADCQPNTG